MGFEVQMSLWHSWYLRGAGMPPGSRHDSPDELKRGSFHLLPDYGIILPFTRATFCHCRAQSDASGKKSGGLLSPFGMCFPAVGSVALLVKNLTLVFTLHGLA